MKIKPLFYGKIENGKIEIYDRKSLTSHLKNLEGEIQLLVEKRKKIRSNDQNRYYWGVVIPLVADTVGYDKESAHEALRIQFLMDRSQKLATLKSTSDLSTMEFEEYLKKIRQWASEYLGVYIPDPNEAPVSINYIT